MRELNINEIENVSGGIYKLCDFVGDATYGFFVFGGTILGAAVTAGVGGAAGGFAGHMVGSWAESVVKEDAGC